MRPDQNPDVADLEEPRTTPGDPSGDSTRPRFSGGFPDVFTGHFVQQNGVGGAVFVGGGDLHRGFDPVTREGRCGGREPRTLYTGRFVQSRRPWRSRARRRRESPGKHTRLQSLSVVEETRAREIGNASRSGSMPLSPAGPGRNRQDPRSDVRKSQRTRDSRAVLEETAPPRESQGA